MKTRLAPMRSPSAPAVRNEGSECDRVGFDDPLQHRDTAAEGLVDARDRHIDDRDIELHDAESEAHGGERQPFRKPCVLFRERSVHLRGLVA
jgi:hypothetical protein